MGIHARQPARDCRETRGAAGSSPATTYKVGKEPEKSKSAAHKALDLVGGPGDRLVDRLSLLRALRDHLRVGGLRVHLHRDLWWRRSHRDRGDLVVVLAAEPRPSGWLFVVPIGWSLVGGSAAILLGVVPDLALFVAAAALTIDATFPAIKRRVSARGFGPFDSPPASSKGWRT